MTLAGCSSDMSDLERYVENAKTKYQGSVKPLPEFELYRSYEYRHEGRNPFSPQSAVERREEPANASGENAPNTNRRKEALEYFPLDSLLMVGTLKREGFRWGLIKDSEGTVHRVRAGNYAGQNYGKITSITENQIEIVELVRNDNGLWEERSSQLRIGEQ
ncbi:type 4 fimbrial biogenesis protein PilP [gamma proteobacterium HTCC5015]|nr:type 4 fimbrial biogenesis protein PilP [gamma proteobacterium HTCC5015]